MAQLPQIPHTVHPKPGLSFSIVTVVKVKAPGLVASLVGFHSSKRDDSCR
jgi:hypothetical protein